MQEHESVIGMKEIEQYASKYAIARNFLAKHVQDLQAEIEAARRKRIADIKAAVSVAAGCHSTLSNSIEQRPDLFEKPKTVVIDGIRLGYRKQKGKVEFDDEEAVISRIRKLVPADQVELLIRVKETVDKEAVVDLTVADLKRLGIRVTDDEDVVHIKATDGDVDKLVKALLADAEKMDGEGN